MADDPWMDESFITPKSFTQTPNTKESNKIVGEVYISSGAQNDDPIKTEDDLIAALKQVQTQITNILKYIDDTKQNKFI